MRKLRRLGTVVVCAGAAISALGAASAIAVGCSSNSTTAASGDGGSPGSDGAMTTLYQRLGGHAGIRDRKSTRLNSSHLRTSRMPSSA